MTGISYEHGTGKWYMHLDEELGEENEISEACVSYATASLALKALLEQLAQTYLREAKSVEGIADPLEKQVQEGAKRLQEGTKGNATKLILRELVRVLDIKINEGGDE